MKKDQREYLAVPGKKIALHDFNTSYKGNLEKEAGKQALKSVKQKISLLQEKMYAANSHSLLIIFQAMDAAGKDSAIEHVLSGINPQGCSVHSFKTPTSLEYEHDFLWRHYKALPQKGIIGVHNRSHYENVLVCKVHPEYVLAERIPGYANVAAIDQKFWNKRYQSIRDFESHLSNNGVVVLKFFLHVSKEEQKQRFLDRINDKNKNWKFSAGDLEERKLWGDYMAAYEDAINETTTKDAPWYIIPADKKWYARLMIAEIIESTLSSLQLKFPELNKQQTTALAGFKKELLKGE